MCEHACVWCVLVCMCICVHTSVPLNLELSHSRVAGQNIPLQLK